MNIPHGYQKKQNNNIQGIFALKLFQQSDCILAEKGCHLDVSPHNQSLICLKK